MKPVLPVLLLCLTIPAVAQTQARSTQVYRCGPEGRDLRDSPCPGGTTPSAVAFDEPSTADSRAARNRHLADAKQAAALASARRAGEAEARRQKAQHIGLQPVPLPAASAPQVTYLKPPKTARPKQPAGNTGR